MGVGFRISADKHLTGSHAFGRNAGISLEAYPQVGGSSARARATDNFVPSTQSNGGSAGCRDHLRSLRNQADGRLEIEFPEIDIALVQQELVCGIGLAPVCMIIQKALS